MVGVVLVLLFIFVIGPIGLFIVGGIWSASHAYLQSEDADRRAAGPADPSMN